MKKDLIGLDKEKKRGSMYEFGAQQFYSVIDPTDQTEDLETITSGREPLY
ncbi:MAG: hypothetical protein ACLRRG_00360 [Barnesiella sp.]